MNRDYLDSKAGPYGTLGRPRVGDLPFPTLTAGIGVPSEDDGDSRGDGGAWGRLFLTKMLAGTWPPNTACLLQCGLETWDDHPHRARLVCPRPVRPRPETTRFHGEPPPVGRDH